LNVLVALAVLIAFLASALGLYRGGHLPGTLPYWIKRLEHSSRQVRLRTVQQLSQLGTAQAAYCLTLVIRSDDLTVKQLALTGLLKARRPGTLSALMTASTDRDSKIRLLIAQGVHSFPDPEVTTLLVDMLRDPDEAVVASAIMSLGSRRDVAAVAPLAQVMGGNEALARLAAEALVEIGHDALEPLIAVIPRLSPLASERLIPVMTTLDPKAAVKPLVELLNNSTSEFVLKEVISTLVGLRTAEATQALIAFIGNEQNACRPYALTKLQFLKDSSVNDLLLKLLKDQDLAIRRAAAEALLGGWDPDWIPHLLEALSDPDEEVVRLVAEALGQYDDSRILPRIFEQLWPTDCVWVVPMLEDTLRKPLTDMKPLEDLFTLLKRISSKEHRGSEEQRLRHFLQSVLILLKPKTVCGFQDLTNTVLVFKGEDASSEYMENRLHPVAVKALKVQPNLKALHLWKTSLR